MILQYVLVLQRPASTEADCDAIIEMEDALQIDMPAVHGFVDGHDFGSGEINLFIHTDVPLEAFRNAQASFSADRRWAEVRAAFSPVEGEQYEVVWPEGLREFSVS